MFFLVSLHKICCMRSGDQNCARSVVPFRQWSQSVSVMIRSQIMMRAVVTLIWTQIKAFIKPEITFNASAYVKRLQRMKCFHGLEITMMPCAGSSSIKNACAYLKAIPETVCLGRLVGWIHFPKKSNMGHWNPNSYWYLSLNWRSECSQEKHTKEIVIMIVYYANWSSQEKGNSEGNSVIKYSIHASVIAYRERRQSIPPLVARNCFTYTTIEIEELQSGARRSIS